jgi:hypothetical protein
MTIPARHAHALLLLLLVAQDIRSLRLLAPIRF